VSRGNLVTGGTGGNTTLLATVVSIDPIRFEFTLDEAAYLRYQRFSKTAGEGTGRDAASSAVKLKLLDEQGFDHAGRMDFVDNVINQSSGTIRGRAVFANPDGLFTPGMFARIQVPGSAPYEALLVPDVAIATEQVRKFVLVIDGDNVARQKYVTIGPVIGTMRVIKTGLSADDRVVINGLMRARLNQKVTPQDQGPPSPNQPVAKTD
jgi:RND family efflux transporter MFP subunit